MNNPFLELVGKNGGFEYTIGFINDEDHFIGGTGNKVWYCIIKGNVTECFMGELNGDVWTDRRILKKKGITEEPAEPGKTMEMILSMAYSGQDYIASSGRKPVTVKIYEMECSHYVFSFGAKAWDIVNDYGITVSYSDVDDLKAGFRLRDITVGKNVKPPKIK